MQRGILVLLLVLLALAALGLAACRPVQPLGDMAIPRQVEGEIFFPSVEEWGGVSVSLDMKFKEVDPATHKAEGYLNWRNFQPNPPEGEPYWKAVDSNVRYAFFGDEFENGDPNSVVVITEITAKDGWGQGNPGEYAYFWLRDGGEQEQDQWGMKYFSFDPWYEFYPTTEAPLTAGYFTAAEMQAEDSVLPLSAEVGDFKISQ